MIASLRGTVTAVGPDGAVVEVGGVGLAVLCTPATLARLRPGQEAALATSLVVRETELALYGFGDADERATFQVLQTASGVGPKLAQAVLAVHAPDDVRRAVAAEDLTALCLVPGIGRKGAARLVLELKDRIGLPHGPTRPAPVTPAASSSVEQLRTALSRLGYMPREVEEAVAAVGADAAGDVGTLLRTALASLRRG